ncbi:MAG TPA: MFS transporter [Polyangiaceae bacterium]|nr:MFS transporter [Polyangiaceae bacterium]
MTGTAEPTPEAQAGRLLTSRALRGAIDGTVSVMLAGYLANLGFSPLVVGTIVTGTLFGSGAVTLAVGLLAHRISSRRALLFAAWLMVGTGVGFAASSSFWPLFVVAVLGTLNPSNGDVSLFLPLEQAALASLVEGRRATTALFARYNVIGNFSGALGSLAVGLPVALSRWSSLALVSVERLVFLVYSAVGVAVALLYARSPERPVARASRQPLVASRAAVLRLAALFSLDSFGGGFVVQSLLALWLFRRFQLSLSAAGAFFFLTSLAASLSQFLSPRLAARIGLVKTMVYTHIPANLLLMSAAFMPTLPLTLSCLLLRACISSMDVPARQAYVMSVVPAEERAAAASVTNVPRSMASAIAPTFAGLLLEHTSFGWPLLCAGALKIVYDLLLLLLFQRSEQKLTLSA